jgi:hypothetical protein
MVSSEIFIETGFEDALNIDRDSFNELHPHYIRVQAYVHGLLHDLIFPVTWGEEKRRNKRRRDDASAQREARFIRTLRTAIGQPVKSIERVENPAQSVARARAVSPVDFENRKGRIEIDYGHPLLQPLFRRKKYAPLVEKIVVAFERANSESGPGKRRDFFYRLLSEIFLDL